MFPPPLPKTPTGSPACRPPSGIRARSRDRSLLPLRKRRLPLFFSVLARGREAKKRARNCYLCSSMVGSRSGNRLLLLLSSSPLNCSLQQRSAVGCLLLLHRSEFIAGPLRLQQRCTPLRVKRLPPACTKAREGTSEAWCTQGQWSACLIRFAFHATYQLEAQSCPSSPHYQGLHLRPPLSRRVPLCARK